MSKFDMIQKKYELASQWVRANKALQYDRLAQIEAEIQALNDAWYAAKPWNEMSFQNGINLVESFCTQYYN